MDEQHEEGDSIVSFEVFFETIFTVVLSSINSSSIRFAVLYCYYWPQQYIYKCSSSRVCVVVVCLRERKKLDQLCNVVPILKA